MNLPAAPPDNGLHTTADTTVVIDSKGAGRRVRPASGSKKTVIDRYANRLAVASAGVPLLMLGSSTVLRALRPEWYCRPVEPGAREFVCGGAYLHPGVSLYLSSLCVAWGVLLVLSAIAFVRGGGRGLGRVAWVFSLLLAVLLVALRVSLGNVDSP